MTRSSSHRLLIAVLRLLAILSVVVVLGGAMSLLARGQTLRPAVRVAYVQQGNIWVLDGASGRRTRLTRDGHDAAPHWTTDGKALLFQRQLRSRIETLRWQPGKGIRQLRDGLWSPDASAVALVRVESHAQSATTVWVARHGLAVRITPIEPAFQWAPLAWSPDSGRLALSRFVIPPPTKPGQEMPPTAASLWVTVGAGVATHLKRLPLPPVSHGHPGWPDVVLWSPEGRFLTVGVGPDMPCGSCRADGRSYYAISIASGTVVPLGTALGTDEAISWASDDAYVVLSIPAGRETYANKHLVRMNPITGTKRTLSHDARWADIEPAVSPGGSLIAFARGHASSTANTVSTLALIASRHLFLMGAHAARPHRLMSAPGWTDQAPVWSPDGQWLLFVRWRRHEQGQAAAAALWAVRADGSNAQRLARLDLPEGFLNGFGYYGAFGWRGLFAVAP